MRKKFMAVMLSACMIFSGLTTTFGAKVIPKIKTDILQNKDDTYTLENYVKSFEEAENIQAYNLLTGKEGIYKITVDADADWINKVQNSYFIDTIDNGLGHYYYSGGVSCNRDKIEELTDKDGKKYIVFTLKNLGYDAFTKQRKELLEVRDKFLATMPNLDKMSDYEKVLGILSFMSYIKYGFDEKGNTIDDAYTTLTGGKATCGGFSSAFNFLAKAINLESKQIINPGVHGWNVVKICGKWYEVEPQSENNPKQSDDTRNMNMKSVLRGTTTMAEKGSPCEYGDLRESLPVSETDYMDYKEHNYTNHVIKWNGNKATFYKTCSDCGEYENDGFEYDSKYKFYHLVDRKYTGTDCDVTKISETKCGDATFTRYEASVTVDGKNYTSEHTVIDGECSHTVKDSDIKVIRKATCSEEGKVEKTCETCGYTWTENIPKTEHHYVTTTTKLDTCEEKSEYTVEKCSMCGSIKETSKKLYYSAHDYQIESINKEPTCTEDGEYVYKCSKCGKTETKKLPATGHNIELVNVKEATCTEKGYTGDKVCKKCGKTITIGREIKAKGHRYPEIISFIKYETIEDSEHKGLMCNYSYEAIKLTCSVCNETEEHRSSDNKLLGWTLADGTEVEKEYGCKYEYVKDVSGNWIPKKIENTWENPTTKPVGAVKPFGETSGKKNEPTETKMKVPAKVKISSAKNLKGKKIAIKWKKVKKATKYQVKAVCGKKTIIKTTKKTSYTIKKLTKGKKYKIYVRAYNKYGYGKWSKAKKVTVKK